MKGFTLIELLAVIVILAIILMIATPMIMNVIDSAKESSAKSSANMFIRQAEQQFIMNGFVPNSLVVTPVTNVFDSATVNVDPKPIKVAPAGKTEITAVTMVNGRVNGTIIYEGYKMTVVAGKITATVKAV